MILAQAEQGRGSESDLIVLPNQDSDHDGLLDNVSPDPLVANYTALKWEVTSFSGSCGVNWQIFVDGGSGVGNPSIGSSKGSFGCALAARHRVREHIDHLAAWPVGVPFDSMQVALAGLIANGHGLHLPRIL